MNAQTPQWPRSKVLVSWKRAATERQAEMCFRDRMTRPAVGLGINFVFSGLWLLRQATHPDG